MGSGRRGGGPGCRMRSCWMGPADRLVRWRRSAGGRAGAAGRPRHALTAGIPAARAGQQLLRVRQEQDQDQAADDGQGCDAGAAGNEPASLRLARQRAVTSSGPVLAKRRGRRPRHRQSIMSRRRRPDVAVAWRIQVAGRVEHRLVAACQPLARAALCRMSPCRMWLRSVARVQHVRPDKPLRLGTSPSAPGLVGFCQRLAPPATSVESMLQRRANHGLKCKCWAAAAPDHSSYRYLKSWNIHLCGLVGAE